MRNLLNEVSFNILTSYFYSDNLVLLSWESNYIQEDLIEKKQVKLYHTDEKQNSTDILTKTFSYITKYLA